MDASQAIYVERSQCPVNTAIGVIEGRWKPMIIRLLGERGLGIGQLRRAMPGVTTKVLRQHLRQLVADGIITRVAAPQSGLRACYQLTDHGRTLAPVFEALWKWGMLHLEHAAKPQL